MEKSKGIIILHGFMGSQLFAAEDIRDENKKIKFAKNERLWVYNPLMDGCFKVSWNPHKSLLPDADNRFEEDDRIEALACDYLGKSVNRITTAGIDDKQFGDYGADGEYGATNLYTDIVVRLKELFGDENVTFLNYDWRKGVEYASLNLKEIIDAIAKKYDAVYIVAHSMGGLVAIDYINKSKYAPKIRLITLGTPFFGAPKALYILNTGKAFPINFGMKALLKIGKNIRAGYDLLPTSDYMVNSLYLKMRQKIFQRNYRTSGAMHLVSDGMETPDAIGTAAFLKSDESGLNTFLLNQSYNLHKNLNALEAFNGMEYSCALVGYGKPTMTEVVIEKSLFYGANAFFNKRLLKSEVEYSSSATNDGDGTVPLVSSTMGGKIKAEKLFYMHELHSGLAHGKASIDFVAAKIENWDNPSNLNYSEKKVAVGFAENTENTKA